MRVGSRHQRDRVECLFMDGEIIAQGGRVSICQQFFPYIQTEEGTGGSLLCIIAPVSLPDFANFHTCSDGHSHLLTDDERDAVLGHVPAMALP